MPTHSLRMTSEEWAALQGMAHALNLSGPNALIRKIAQGALPIAEPESNTQRIASLRLEIQALIALLESCGFDD